MKIGIVGGTGDIGEGIAMRLAPKYDVVVGSRDEARAQASCVCSLDKLKNRGNSSCVLKGATNQDAVSCSDVVILAVPFKNAQVTLEGLSGFEDKIVISPINPMEKRDYFMFVPPAEGSAALMVRNLLPKNARICSAFNTIAANKWKALEEDLTYSVPVCGDDPEAKKVVMDIVNSASKLQAYDAGPLAASSMVESLTPLLLNIARYNKMRDVGMRFL
jgi:NADPH-dependent F420 reductase